MHHCRISIPRPDLLVANIPFDSDQDVLFIRSSLPYSTADHAESQVEITSTMFRKSPARPMITAKLPVRFLRLGVLSHARESFPGFSVRPSHDQRLLLQAILPLYPLSHASCTPIQPRPPPFPDYFLAFLPPTPKARNRRRLFAANDFPEVQISQRWGFPAQLLACLEEES